VNNFKVSYIYIYIYIYISISTGLYLERKSKTGKESDAMTYAEFLIGVEDMKWEPPLGNHGLILPNGSSN